MSGDQSQALGTEQPCPGRGKLCQIDHRVRAIQFRGGTADLVEPVAHCSTCRRDFFPLRPVLKLDAHCYGPTLLQRILLMAGMADSSEAAAMALQVVGEIRICPRTVNELGAQLGGQLADERDRRTQACQQRPLPRVATPIMNYPCRWRRKRPANRSSAAVLASSRTIWTRRGVFATLRTPIPAIRRVAAFLSTFFIFSKVRGHTGFLLP
jgi:hypothetical protein